VPITPRLSAALMGGAMSFKALAWAFEQQIGNPQKTVLIALAYRDNHDDPHGCFPSIPRIALDCGLSERTVQRCLLWLEELKFIKRRSRPHTSTFYYMPLAWVVSDSHHPGGPQSPPLVSDSHPEPKVLTVIERKPRAQTRSARNRFDEMMEQKRKIEAQGKRLLKEQAVAVELNVGGGPR
jgi:Helix-turn-helix domain